MGAARRLVCGLVVAPGRGRGLLLLTVDHQPVIPCGDDRARAGETVVRLVTRQNLATVLRGTFGEPTRTVISELTNDVSGNRAAPGLSL